MVFGITSRFTGGCGLIPIKDSHFVELKEERG